MTGAFWGADAGELEAFARRLQAVASDLEGIGGSLSSTLAATTWQGPDAELFQSDWHGVHARAVAGAVEVLRQAATKVDFEARQQLDASGSSGFADGPVQLSGVIRRIESISNRWGWAIGPIVAKIPGVGTA